MPWVYLAGLTVSLTGMVVLDRRFRLFFWADWRRASLVVLFGIIFFSTWDAAGIGLGIFFRGPSDFVTGIVLAPEFPIEEPVFLALLCYLTMNIFALAKRALVKECSQ